MGFYDRPYLRDGHGGGGLRGSFSAGVRFGMPRPAKAVKTMLLINVGAYVIQVLAGDHDPTGSQPVSSAFAVMVSEWWQLWRYVTFQFLHGGIGHIFWNMLWLYFLGSMLERHLGTRRFAWFYLTSGAVAGIAYAVIGSMVGLDPSSTLIGASGGLFAIALGCAVVFPNVRVLLLFMFPIPLRIAVLFFFGRSALIVLEAVAEQAYSNAFWSEIAHLGGAAGGALWIWVLPRASGASTQVRVKVNQGAWDRKMRQKDEEEKSIDEILRKIHDEGINSLSRKEKKTLAEATKRQRQHGE
ncbi:MAG: rhomboid family intramembrane serine protease [Planctomycetota bacterium]|jgi:membrane associated rhomboid family serine protease